MKDIEFEEMKRAQESFHDRAMKIPGVHGTSIGLKMTNNELTDKFAICIHVLKKKEFNKIPEQDRIPEKINGFLTDVIEHGQIKPCVDGEKYRPLQGGTQITTGVPAGFPTFKFGTLGCFVRDIETGTVLGLSNQHVLEKEMYVVGQPTAVFEEIGLVVRLVKNEKVDAGLTTISYSDIKYKNSIIDIGYVKGSRNVLRSQFPFNVRKRGRTTKLTKGKITHIMSGITEDGLTYFDQLFIQPDPGTKFMEQGDSGSALVDDNTHVVGLCWGATKEGCGVANQIKDVLEELNVEVLTSGMKIKKYPKYNAGILRKFELLLTRGTGGKKYWDTYKHFEDEIRHMFHSIPELHMIWLKMPHAEIVEELEKSLSDENYCIPDLIGNTPTNTMFNEFNKHLSNNTKEIKLKNSASSFCELIKNNIGKNLRDVLDE